MGRCIVLTEGDHSLLQEMFRWYQRNKNLRHQFRRRSIFGGGGDTASAILAAGGRVYEVQDSAMGDGIYNCVKLQLESDNWTDETSKDKFYLDGLKIWKADYHYVVDDIVLYSDSYYGCVTDHTSEAGTPPPNGEFIKIWIWGYATEAWDSGTPYVVGDRVIYGSKHYLCIHNNTNRIPDIAPLRWKETYVADDFVYRTIGLTDHFFKCTTTHIAAANKQPPNTSYWESLFILEVLNLQESDPTASIALTLAEGDRMAVWKTADNARNNRYSNNRYIGLPFSIVGTKNFKVIEAGTGGGIYNCYEQIIKNDKWGDGDPPSAFRFKNKNTTLVEVLNMHECVALDNENYERALGKNDTIAAWPNVDDAGVTRWLGIATTPQVRQLAIAEAVPTASGILCDLVCQDGHIATVGELGYHLKVYCDICGPSGGSGLVLDESLPRLGSGYLQAQCIGGKWRATAMFQLMKISELDVEAGGYGIV